MSFIANLLKAPAFIETLASSVENNPTVKKIESYLPTVVFVLITKQFSFEIDGYVVTAKINGAPSSFTIAALFLALENIEQGKVGVVTSGDVELDIVKVPTATETPTPA